MKKVILIAICILIATAYLLIRKQQNVLDNDLPLVQEKISPSVSTPPSPGPVPGAAVPTAANADAVLSKAGVPEVKKITIEEFRALAKKVAKELPTKEQMQSLSAEEAHGTPKPIMEAGNQLGDIAEALDKNPDLSKDGFSFYEGCSKSGKRPDSVRALCYANYKKLGEKMGYPLRSDAAPRRVKDLAKNLEGL